MKKMVSVILSVCLLLTLLPTTVFATDQTADAGAKIVQKSYDDSTKILTVDMQIKLPDAVGITSVATMISYDSSKLTLIVEDYTAGEKEQVPTSTRTTLADTCTPATVALKTVNNARYSFIDSALYGTGNRAGLLITLGKSTPGMPSHTSQKTTDWLSIYSLRFKVSGPAATTLNSTSLRIADPNLENELVKYTYDNAHSNNYYTVAVVDGNTGLEYYFGKMKDNPGGELSGMQYLMDAVGNNTATYPGSTNPVTPPAPATYTVRFDANGGTGSMADVTDVSGEYMLPANGFTAPTNKQFKGWATSASGTVITGTSITVTADTTLYAIWEPIPATTYTVTVQNDGNGTASASPATAAAGTEITLSATANSGYVFDKWDNKTPSDLSIDTDGKFIMPGDNVSVKATFKPAALTGTASITGTLKYGQELTATLTGSNNTGNLDYKWYQNGTTQVAANNTGKYTLRADDIGKTITVKITSNVQTGEITSAATATVVKADGPAAPSVTSIACTNSSNNDGKITGVNTTMEYSTASDFATKTACTGSEITGLANGTYYVRVAETTTHKAGTAATVNVPAYTPGVLGGSASISGTAKYDEVLTAVTSSITGNTGTFSYQWKRSGTDITSATNSTYKLVEDDIGKTITVAITSSVESGTIVSSPTAAVEKADGPAAPSVTPVACTNSSNNDGKITGVNTTMEYQKSGAATWTACSGTEVTGLTNGTYYVRVAETTTHKAGTAATVIVSAYTPGVPTEYTITFDGNGGTPSTSSMTTTGQKLTSLPTATRSGSYTFAGWYTAASGGTKVTTSTIFNANTTIYAQWTYTGGSVVIIPDTDETDKSEPENPGTGAAVNPGTGAAAAGSSFGYPFVALAAVHAIYAGTKKLAKKDED